VIGRAYAFYPEAVPRFAFEPPTLALGRVPCRFAEPVVPKFAPEGVVAPVDRPQLGERISPVVIVTETVTDIVTGVDSEALQVNAYTWESCAPDEFGSCDTSLALALLFHQQP
jgi:hypothetical protein